MRVFVHNAADPRSAVEMFTDGCMKDKDWELVIVGDHRSHAVLTDTPKKPKKLYVVVTATSPWEIVGWFDGRDLDPDFHLKGTAWIVKKSDPIWKHPKQLLDDFHRG